MDESPPLDFVRLTELDRSLIVEACGQGATRIFLERMDKGLSGSDVWLARWIMESGVGSKFHALKIGDTDKLRAELDAINSVPAVIERGFPAVNLYEKGDRALLRQEFLGSAEGAPPRSLRHHLSSLTPAEAGQLMEQLFLQRMKPYLADSPTVQAMTYGGGLDRWRAKQDLPRAAAQVGRDGLDRSLDERHSLRVEDLEREVERIADLETEGVVGAVHGDLHSQNVIVDEHGNLHLIDWAWAGERWRLIDFLMMECSLKFLVSPPHARLEDLLNLEDAIESSLNDGAAEQVIDWESWERRIHGRDLARCGRALQALRRCAREVGALLTREQYRAGLIMITAGVASIPEPINRVFLFHSLARHVSMAKEELQS